MTPGARAAGARRFAGVLGQLLAPWRCWVGCHGWYESQASSHWRLTRVRVAPDRTETWCQPLEQGKVVAPRCFFCGVVKGDQRK